MRKSEDYEIETHTEARRYGKFNASLRGESFMFIYIYQFPLYYPIRENLVCSAVKNNM